jgi:hypothetical protein
MINVSRVTYAASKLSEKQSILKVIEKIATHQSGELDLEDQIVRDIADLPTMFKVLLTRKFQSKDSDYLDSRLKVLLSNKRYS